MCGMSRYESVCGRDGSKTAVLPIYGTSDREKGFGDCSIYGGAEILTGWCWQAELWLDGNADHNIQQKASLEKEDFLSFPLILGMENGRSAHVVGFCFMAHGALCKLRLADVGDALLVRFHTLLRFCHLLEIEYLLYS